MKDLAIYIHIPFCVSKCIYCNFVSFTKPHYDIEKYFEALKLEIKENAKNYTDYLVKSIFIGGGTPSFVDVNYIREIIDILKENYNISKNVEFTIESNPNSLSEEKIKVFKEIGVNRFSIGLQSADNNLLKILNRPHTKEDFVEVIKNLKKYDIENINVDILIDIPNQTMETLKNTLDFVISLQVKHISAYGLICEKNTKLYKLVNAGKINLLEENLSVKMYDFVVKYLKKYTYYRYEVSNFSQKGYECKHNLVYWDYLDYLGFGIASHSKINKKRMAKTENYEKYILNPTKYISQHNLTKSELFEEKIMLGLRKKKGLNIKELNQEFSINFLVEKESIIKNLTELKLIYKSDKFIKCTNKGFKFLNFIIRELVE